MRILLVLSAVVCTLASHPVGASAQGDTIRVHLTNPNEMRRVRVGPRRVIAFYLEVNARRCRPSCTVTAIRSPEHHTSPDSVRLSLVLGDITQSGPQPVRMNSNDVRYYPWRSVFQKRAAGNFTADFQQTIPKFSKTSGEYGPYRFRVEWRTAGKTVLAYTEPFLFKLQP
jgi:hypothetical protein